MAKRALGIGIDDYRGPAFIPEWTPKIETPLPSSQYPHSPNLYGLSKHEKVESALLRRTA